MNTKKHINNLQKSSGLFLQLGLVLTLLTVYLALELKTEEKRTAISIENHINIDDPYEFDNIKDFVVEPKAAIKKTKPIVKVTKPISFVISETPTTTDAPPFEPVDVDTPNPTPTKVTKRPEIVDVIEDDDFVETIASVDEVPVFPGCERVAFKEKKACFEKNLRKFIGKKFNSELASQLGLSSGKQKIYVAFIVTKTGEIEITKTRAVHKKLEKEGRRVVNKLPKMIPGKKAGKTVNMKYILPISLEVL